MERAKRFLQTQIREILVIKKLQTDDLQPRKWLDNQYSGARGGGGGGLLPGLPKRFSFGGNLV